FDDQGQWDDTPEWYSEMWPPGIGDEQLPLAKAHQGLQWLGARIAQDDRFALSAVYNLYRGLSGQEPLVAPSDYEDPMYEQRFESFLAQANTFRTIADKLIAGGYNLKVAVKEL